MKIYVMIILIFQVFTINKFSNKNEFSVRFILKVNGIERPYECNGYIYEEDPLSYTNSCKYEELGFKILINSNLCKIPSMITVKSNCEGIEGLYIPYRIMQVKNIFKTSDLTKSSNYNVMLKLEDGNYGLLVIEHESEYLKNTKTILEKVNNNMILQKQKMNDIKTELIKLVSDYFLKTKQKSMEDEEKNNKKEEFEKELKNIDSNISTFNSELKKLYHSRDTDMVSLREISNKLNIIDDELFIKRNLLKITNKIYNRIKLGCKNGECIKDSLKSMSEGKDQYIKNNSTILETLVLTGKEMIMKTKSLSNDSDPNEEKLKFALNDLNKI